MIIVSMDSIIRITPKLNGVVDQDIKKWAIEYNIQFTIGWSSKSLYVKEVPTMGEHSVEIFHEEWKKTEIIIL